MLHLFLAQDLSARKHDKKLADLVQTRNVLTGKMHVVKAQRSANAQ